MEPEQKVSSKKSIALMLIIALLIILIGIFIEVKNKDNAGDPATNNDQNTSPEESVLQIEGLGENVEARAVTFGGGYETEPGDEGLPIILLAAGVAAPDQIFRDAFNKTIKQGEDKTDSVITPEDEDLLLDIFAADGVDAPRIRNVIETYRYKEEDGGLWAHTPAKAYATIEDGKITGFVVTEAGSGYSSKPTITVEGFGQINTTISIVYSTTLAKNGSILSIELERFE